MGRRQTLYDKLVESHTVKRLDNQAGPGASLLLYVDRSVLNEYTSPQAFTGLREAKRRLRRPQAILAVVDHVNPTSRSRGREMPDAGGQRQVDYFAENCADFGIELFDVLHPQQGIEHVVAPEMGFILPGMVVAAGDSHTTTYGALGTLGFGIGTSDIEHMLATQTVPYRRLKTMRVTLDGVLPRHVTAKDMALALIAMIGADGATGFAIEYQGTAVAALSADARMTLCNMAVECGARGALIAPDQTVFAYLQDKPRVPQGALWTAALAQWRRLASDDDAVFDRQLRIDISDVAPMVTWGTSPDQAAPIDALVPSPETVFDPAKRYDMERALGYMDLRPGTRLDTVPIDRAFIGSCTNARLSDLEDAAAILRGRRVAKGVRAMVVPGSSAVRRAAEGAGLDRVFVDAGFEWRQSGCSLCLAMNDDVLAPGERCASSTNRNFEGRQGRGGRTHLMSPAMVAAAAIAGHLVDLRTFPTTEGIP